MAIGTNYLVTYDQVKNSLYVPIKAAYIDDQTKIMTKQDLITYFYVDASYLSGYSSTQCVMYQDIQTPPPVTVTLNARKQFAPDTLYVYYGLQDITLVSPIEIGAALTRAGATLSPTISVRVGETITITTSDVNGPNNVGSKPTTCDLTAYPAFATACTGFVTYTIITNQTIWISSGNGYTTWCL